MLIVAAIQAAALVVLWCTRAVWFTPAAEWCTCEQAPGVPVTTPLRGRASSDGHVRKPG
ncbi:hypothetical protein AB0G49_22465 [Streptomyces longwoodensis]|uniref:hypothetical protein n=1 Tax=Streptomyces longwoodensis TaxID=68231 RepID=UPI003401B210